MGMVCPAMVVISFGEFRIVYRSKKRMFTEKPTVLTKVSRSVRMKDRKQEKKHTFPKVPSTT